MIKYKFIMQLALGDHRLFKGSDDEYYIADNSGYDPERTDDGPLRLKVDEPLFIGERSASVAIYSVRLRGNTYFSVGMSYEAAIALYNYLRSQGCTMRLEFSSAHNDLRQLIMLATMQQLGY